MSIAVSPDETARCADGSRSHSEFRIQYSKSGSSLIGKHRHQNLLRRNRRPSCASPSCVGASGRQMAAARAIDFTAARERLDHRRALIVDRRGTPATTSSHGTWPDPGAPRSFSHACRCFSRGPAARIASPIDCSSMFMWNVSSSRPHAGMIDAIDDLDRLRREIEEARLEAVERLDADHDAALAGVGRQLLQLADEEVEILLALVGRRLPRPADGAIERPDDVGGAERLRGVDAVLHVRACRSRARWRRRAAGRGPGSSRRTRSCSGRGP